MKQQILIGFLLLLISIPAVKSLLQPGGFTSHDLTHHVIRQISMDKLLSEGQILPRWSADLNNGYGYPVFLFNYPMPAILGEVFHKLGLNFVDSVKAVLFTSMIISVLGMYLFLKALLGSKLAAFLGAVFYLYAPLRFLNVYVSASIGSSLALGILPFIFLSIVKLAQQPSLRGVLVGALSLAALITSHNVTTLIFAPFVLVFSMICARLHSDNHYSGLYLRNLVLMFLLGLGLASWFWLPAIVEKQYLLFDQIYKDFYKDQFVNVWQLIRSPWGYGLSHPQNPEPGDMSYQLGLTQILVMLILIPTLWFYRKIREFRVIGTFVLILFLASVFLMLKISLSWWDKLPFLSLVQFPLRFQAISLFCASIAVSLLIKYLPVRKFLFVILLILVIYANRNHWSINDKFDPGESYYLSLKTTSSSYGEHLPKWGRIMDKAAVDKLEFARGTGEIRVIKDKSAQILVQVEASRPATLKLNQFYFPGWEIKVDNKPIIFNYLTDGENYGLPFFDIDVGEHQIIAEFKNTPIRNLADSISLIGLIGWILLLRGTSIKIN